MWAVIMEISPGSAYYRHRNALIGAVVDLYRQWDHEWDDDFPTLQVRFHKLWLEMNKDSIRILEFEQDSEVMIRAKYKPLDEGGNDNE